MRTIAEKFIPKIILAALSILILSVPVIASEPVTVKIPVTCNAENTDDQFIYTITGSENAPMPKTTSITLKDKQTGEFIISYEEPNSWRYEIKQEKAVPERNDMTYDKTVYHALVFIGVKPDDSLYSELAIIKEGSSSKSSACEFVNTATGHKTVPPDSKAETPTPTPTPTPAKTPTSTPPSQNRTQNYTSTSPSQNSTTNNSSNVQPVNPSQKANMSDVQTGDTKKPLLYITIMIVTLLILAEGLVKKRDTES